MNEFLMGAFAMASAAISVFFLRYFRASGDRLFLTFALAFAMLAVERTFLQIVGPLQEGRHWIFLARLGAFLLIIVGVLDKNRGARSRSSSVWFRRLRTSSL